MNSRLKLFYSTREKYPTFRVDLTELFSRELVSRNYQIDWHMQAFEPGQPDLVEVNDSERVFVGSAASGGGLFGRISNLFSAIAHDLKIYTIVSRGDYDIVQVRDKPLAGLVAALAAKKTGALFCYWVSFPYPEADLFRSQDTEIHIPGYLRLYYRLRGLVTDWLLYRLVLPRADHVFVQSDQMQKDIEKKAIRAEDMTPVPMGISLYQLQNLQLPEVDLSALQGRTPIIYVGTMVRVRRIDFLIDVLRLLKSSRPNTVLLLVGDASDSDMAFLRQAARDRGVEDSVVFTGFVPVEQAWSYIKCSAVALSPFRPSPILDSTSPTKVVEYLALEKPVVANKHPDQSKVLGDSGAGYAVDYTPEAFCEAVLRIIDDPGLAAEMGEKGRRYVEQHRSYASLGEKLDSDYRSLLEAYNGKGKTVRQ